MKPDSPKPDAPKPSQPRFDEARDPAIDQSVLARSVRQLDLALTGTRLEKHVDRLYAELTAAGLVFHPPVYLSDEWGCPDQVPIIGVPFYLADEKLTRLHDQIMEGVEAESDRDIMRYLRHEAGHAFNYAYRLFDTPEWTDLFGPFVRPYPDEYQPRPYSRSYVRHLPGWYAQKHPDEDFAETFAVWLDPASDWQRVYAGWPCLKKLNYLSRIAAEIGSKPPAVTADDYDTNEQFLDANIGDLYKRWAQTPGEPPHAFDSALAEVFVLPDAPASGTGTPASTAEKPASAEKFLIKHRRAISMAVFHWTGLDDALVRTLLNHLQQRCVALDLRVPANHDAALIQVVALVTMLATNRVQTGEFVHT